MTIKTAPKFFLEDLSFAVSPNVGQVMKTLGCVSNLVYAREHKGAKKKRKKKDLGDWEGRERVKKKKKITRPGKGVFPKKKINK